MNWREYFSIVDFDGVNLFCRGAGPYWLEFETFEEAREVARSWADWIEHD
jgi:hypothetical protein